MTAKLPQIPGGPDPSEPIPRSPVDGFDLVAYAGVVAALAQRAEPRAVTLASFKLNEARWLAIEQTWLLRIATALLQNDGSLSKAYDEAFQEAQEALEKGPPLSLEEFAAMVARIEDGQEPAVAIAAAGLSLGAFARAQRTWAARIAGDGRIASSFWAAVAAQRGR